MSEGHGKLLVDELPSVLKEHGDHFLHITINYDEKVIETSLNEELRLGKDMFDPFMLMGALDRAPSTVAFWNVLLSDLKERQIMFKRELSSFKGGLRSILATQIEKRRPTGSSKSATITEVDDAFTNYILIDKESSADDFAAYLNEDPNALLSSEAMAKRKEYIQKQTELDLVTRQVDKISIIARAWSEQEHTLKSQVAIMQTLIQQGLIKIPSRAVYENWEKE